LILYLGTQIRIEIDKQYCLNNIQYCLSVISGFARPRTKTDFLTNFSIFFKCEATKCKQKALGLGPARPPKDGTELSISMEIHSIIDNIPTTYTPHTKNRSMGGRFYTYTTSHPSWLHHWLILVYRGNPSMDVAVVLEPVARVYLYIYENSTNRQSSII